MCDHSSGVIAGWMLDEDDEQECWTVIGELCVWCQPCQCVSVSARVLRKFDL